MKEEYELLQKSEEFKTWKKTNNDTFLAYAFLMKGHVKEEWQFGYYNEKTDKVTAFTVSDKIIINPESEIFRQDSVKPMDVSKVKIGYEEALKLVEELKKKEYPHFKTMQQMAILQNMDIGQVWNITLIPADYKVLNVKIDSESGEVVKQGIVELFSFQK